MALEELMLVNPKGKYPRRKSLQIVFPKPVKHMKVNPSAIDRVKEASTVLIPQYLKLKGWKDVVGSGAGGSRWWIAGKTGKQGRTLRPVHLNLAETTFKLKYNSGNEKAYTLQQNCAIFLAEQQDRFTSTRNRWVSMLAIWIAMHSDHPKAIGVQLKGVSADPDVWFIGYAVVSCQG